MPLSVATTTPAGSRLVATNLLQLIGNTPLIRLERIARPFPGVEMFGKAEFFNPGGSVKDRAGLNMIRDGERSGKLTRDKIILDATSGNTGIAYAMIGAYLGYKVKLCLPKNASMERKHVLQAYGAEMVFSDPGEGSDGAIRLCQQIYKADPERYFYPDQYNNPGQLESPLRWDGARDPGADRWPHHALCGVDGHQRHVHGKHAAAREEVPGVKCISAQPSSGFHGLEGLKHMPTAIVPGIYDPSAGGRKRLDRNRRRVRDVPQISARRSACWLASPRAPTFVAASKVAQELVDAGQRGVIVTVLCDGAYKYLSEPFWNALKLSRSRHGLPWCPMSKARFQKRGVA